jgi:hypothetical protein
MRAHQYQIITRTDHEMRYPAHLEGPRQPPKLDPRRLLDMVSCWAVKVEYRFHLARRM